jgi:hypothetical protein
MDGKWMIDWWRMIVGGQVEGEQMEKGLMKVVDGRSRDEGR